MAQNVKNKKKKRSNYDSKIIKIIAVTLSVAVVAIVSVALFLSYNSSYVAKVDGERIMTYEYKYFLTNTMYEMKNDAIKEGTLKEDADAAGIAAFWTAERKKSAEDKALDEARKWKAQYILAENAGFGLDYDERENCRATVEYNLYSMYQQYQSYYAFNEFAEMYLGMPLDEYQEIEIQNTAIAEYKTELKKAYSATDAELKKLYDETPDDYRKITMSVLALAKPEAPKEVKEPDGGVDKKKEDFKTETEWNDYSDKVKAYKKYLDEKKDYDAKVKEITDRRTKIFEALKVGKYTEEKVKTDSSADNKTETTPGATTTPSATVAPSATTAPSATAAPSSTAGTDKKEETTSKDDKEYVYKDATLADIAKKEGALFAEESGKVVINAVKKCGQDILDEIALNMQWKDEKRNVIVCKDKDGKEKEEYNGGETVDGTTYTQYVLLDDDHYYYIVRCEGIEDFENSKESKEGAADSIKDTVRNDMYEDKAVAELEAKITAGGKTYAVTSKKQDEITAIVKAVGWN